MLPITGALVFSLLFATLHPAAQNASYHRASIARPANDTPRAAAFIDAGKYFVEKPGGIKSSPGNAAYFPVSRLHLQPHKTISTLSELNYQPGDLQP
ncbi:hypothetical protein ACQKLP_20505 [Chitinophaga sp. NPDC101104]|uniref:hypothetical protein n=1 Tax=Chitinophaga sp. NPDC101104 TaxID=3390561 RepID=UPI003D04097D